MESSSDKETAPPFTGGMVYHNIPMCVKQPCVILSNKAEHLQMPRLLILLRSNNMIFPIKFLTIFFILRYSDNI